MGSSEAVTKLQDGSLLIVGSHSGKLGAIGKVDARGELQWLRALAPETIRPASLLDVTTLPDGDALALGYLTTSIGGVAQSEITLTRFGPEGEIRWSKKISRGRFFSQDGQTMFVRAPNRLQFDAEGNIYFSTYLSGGGSNWRSHLVKLSPDGELIYSRAYGANGQSAGQGRILVLGSGAVWLFNENVLSRDGSSLVALSISADGRPEKAAQLPGQAFDVSGVAIAGGDFFITGATERCGEERRFTYLTKTSSDLVFGNGDCPTEALTFTAGEVPVEILPSNYETESVPIEAHAAPTLGPMSLDVSAASCYFQDVDTVLTVCGGQPVRYMPFIPARAQVQWSDDNSRQAERSFQRPGSYVLAVTTECATFEHRLEVRQPAVPSPLLDTLPQCTPGEPVILTVPLNPNETLSWEDGDTLSLRTVVELGTYRYSIATKCDTTVGSFTVIPESPVAVADSSIQVSLCAGDSIRFAADSIPGFTAEWSDGYPSPERWLAAAGTYNLQYTDGCREAVTIIDINTENCCSVYLPSAFSPNGDRVNDVYFPSFAGDDCNGVQELTMEVYDRWGGLTYEGAEAWTGADAATGYYLVVIRYLNEGIPLRHSAEVLLVR